MTEPQIIFECQIAKDSDCELIAVKIEETRRYVRIEQEGCSIWVSKWQALELAIELLNIRKYLKARSNKNAN